MQNKTIFFGFPWKMISKRRETNGQRIIWCHRLNARSYYCPDLYSDLTPTSCFCTLKKKTDKKNAWTHLATRWLQKNWVLEGWQEGGWVVGGLGWRPPPTDTTSVERGTVPRSSPRVVGRPHLIPLDSPLIGLRTRQPKKHCNNRKSCPFTSNFRSSCHHLSSFCPTPPPSSSIEEVIHKKHFYK